MFFISRRRRHTRFDCDWSSDVCSSDLVRQPLVLTPEQQSDRAHLRLREQLRRGLARTLPVAFGAALPRREPDDVDRKSTRLNSSHSQISYAVFCLKKKKKHQ